VHYQAVQPNAKSLSLPAMLIHLIKALKKEQKKAAALESRIAERLEEELVELHHTAGS